MLSARAALFSLLALSVPAASVACAPDADEAPPAEVDDLTKTVTTKALVKGNTELAADLYGELTSGKDNVFFSPYSISSALAMAYAGAKKGTATAMRGTLHFPAGNVHGAFHSLGGELAKRAHVEGKDAFQLAIASSLWGEKSQHFESAFMNVLKDNYGAGLMTADFRNKAESERTRINEWVEDATQDKIKNLIPPKALKGDTKLVLVNAIYFKAKWQTPFNANATETEDFTTLAGPKVQADMMNKRASFKYAATSAYDAVAMPYQGGDVELVAIAPKAGTFETFESKLDGDELASIYDGLAYHEVKLHFPKFKITGSSIQLKETLSKLGMGVAFTNDADLSGITGKSDTKISDVVHKAFIDLDENGTEAAAATAVIVVGKTAIPHPVAELRFDRPFVFAIRDVPTGTILFLGRVTNPKG